jgi:cellulose synthase operon protein C
LFEQLMGGSYEAGERLAELYGPCAPQRSRDLLVVRKHQAALRPGDRPTLEKLHQAALLDRNPAYAHAVEHILLGFDPSARPAPPPALSVLPEAPDLVTALLFRNVDSPLNEALAITWDTGRYRRDANHYGLTGVERVQPGAATAVGDAYGHIARLLGSARTGLFHRRALGPPSQMSAQVVLLSPPAIVLSGEVREETPELRYALGAALAGAMPEHVLVGGLSEEQLRTLIEALRAAFGPVGPTSRTDPGVARLGQDLWQIVPPRGDRRLREIFAQPQTITYESAVESTRRAMRRAGLFAAGDVPTAINMAIAELGLSLDEPLSAPLGLARACAAHAPLADLLRLATRSEYAEARWHAASAPDRRRDGGARRFRGT